MSISVKALVIGLIIGLVIGGASIWFVKPKEIERVTETVLVTETISGPTKTVTKTFTGPTVTETVAKTTIKFVFDFTRKPSDFYKGNTDTRDLAAAFDYIQFLDRNSSVLKTIEFGWGDEKYLGEGWYVNEDWNGRDISWTGKNATITLDDLDILDKAHFLRIMAGSIGKTNYQEEFAEFKDLMSDTQGIQVYFDGNPTDKIDIYPRRQISYINLRPEADSDLDGIIDKLDPNPRIPEPKPVKSDIKVAIYYVIFRSPDWEIEPSYHSLLGFYDCTDPDVVDWHIKWAVEHGIAAFIIPNTRYDIDAITLENGLLRAKYLPYIHFSMLFNEVPWMPGNPYGNDPNKLDEITNEIITYYSRNYFNHPQYLKIDDKPLVMFRDGGYRFIFDLEKYHSYIDGMRNIGKRYGYDIFLVGHVVGEGWQFPGGEDWQGELSEPFDAISAYTMNDAGVGWKYDEEGNVYLVEPYDLMVDGFIEIARSVSEKAEKFGVGFIPLVQAGFDNSARYDKGIDNWLVIRTGSSPEKFMVMCEGVKPYVDPNLNMVIVEAWNEFHEGSVIEPTEEFGFGYLNVLRNVFSVEVNEAIEKGYRFLGENLWDEAKGAYRECPPGSEGLENNYWGDDNYLALTFHRDYERFKDSERVNRIQQFLEKNPPRLEIGLRRWCVLSADNYTQYQPYNNWEYADQVALDGIYYARIDNVEKAKECFNYLIEKMYSNGLIEDEATHENGHEYYKLALALILAHHLKYEDPTANTHIPILTEKLLELQERDEPVDGSWLTDDKPPSWPNTETTILILIALNLQTRYP